MRLRLLLTALLVMSCAANARAAKVDAKLVPDGLYTVTVEKVIDSEHLTVKMENGVEVDLKAASHTVTFSNQTSSRVKIYLMQGEIVSVGKA